MIESAFVRAVDSQRCARTDRYFAAIVVAGFLDGTNARAGVHSQSRAIGDVDIGAITQASSAGHGQLSLRDTGVASVGVGPRQGERAAAVLEEGGSCSTLRVASTADHTADRAATGAADVQDIGSTADIATDRE